MKTTVYLQGYCTPCETLLICPLSSVTVLYMIQYCQTDIFQVVFVDDGEISRKNDQHCCKRKLKEIASVEMSFVKLANIPVLLRNVSLPSLYQPKLSLVRSGLCVVLRSIITEAHAAVPDLNIIDLLGFRQGSMKMCAEVCLWTKLCEIDLPSCISELVMTLRSQVDKVKSGAGDGDSIVLTIPSDLVKLEREFHKESINHNENLKRRSELNRLRKCIQECDFSEIKICNISNNQVKGKPVGLLERKVKTCDGDIVSKTNGDRFENSFKVDIETLLLNKNHLLIEATVHLNHGTRKLKVDKQLSSYSTGTVLKDNLEDINGSNTFIKSTVTTESSLETKLEGVCLDEVQGSSESTEPQCLAKVLKNLRHKDLELVHQYSLGDDMSIGDLILLPYVYYFVEALNFDCTPLMNHIPNILTWATHLMSLDLVQEAGKRLGWSVELFTKSLLESQSPLNYEKDGDVIFIPDNTSCLTDDDMELCAMDKMKYKAMKPKVIKTLQKLDSCKVEAITGTHPLGEKVQVDWNSLPPGVHPKEGKVPEKRMNRKCQQLENLVTASQSMAKPGDIIVDFCSGGGHLGIVLAYLLPECQVYLVENKEESLLKACSRLESLNLSNVTLYQCNLDYFIGDFQIGVCLHACGSATDMVLQLCLNTLASFVICPCCYGSIRETHHFTYPRSETFLRINLTYEDFLNLGHGADQTEKDIALETQGRKCMNLVDTDRAEFARQHGYLVTLCSLQPLSCSPKNNLLIGQRNSN